MLRIFGIVATVGVLSAGAAFSQERTTYQSSGAWRIDGVLTPYGGVLSPYTTGRLSYVLNATDETGTVGLQFYCQPAEGSNAADTSGVKIVGPFWQSIWKNITFSVDTAFVSFSIDGRPPSQVKGSIFLGREIDFPRQAIGVGTVVTSLKKARNNIELSIQNIPAVIDARGFAHLEPVWERLCIGDTRAVRRARDIAIIDK